MTVDNVQERAGVVTFKGQPMTLLGPALRRGDPAPSFALTSGDLSTVTPEILLDEGKRAALLIVVPSLDTNVCSLESKKFNDRLGERRGQHGFAVCASPLVHRRRRRQAADAFGLP
jgi:thiol peroxidase